MKLMIVILEIEISEKKSSDLAPDCFVVSQHGGTTGEHESSSS